MDQYQYVRPLAMDRQLDVLRCHEDGGILLAASALTGRYWLGSLWFYQTPQHAPNVQRCTAGVQLEAGLSDALWVDRSHVVVALDTGGIAVWSLIDDLHTFVLDHAASGHDDLATSVSINANKTKIVSCSCDKSVKVWDLSTVSLLSSHQAHSDSVSCVDCHQSEDDLCLSCSQDGKILLWDRRKPRPASLLSASLLRDTPTCVRWQPSELHKFAVGSETGQVALIDTRMGVENYLTCTPHTRPIHSIQFSPHTPSLLASVGEDSQVVVTKIEEEGMRQIYADNSHSDFVHGLSWSSASQLLTCGWDSKVISHDVTTATARPMGQGQGVLVNGDTDKHEVTKRVSGKTSYCQAVQNGQEMET